MEEAKERNFVAECECERPMRRSSQVPVYFAEGMVEKANLYYKLFINWMNESLKGILFLRWNCFIFQFILMFQ